MLSSFHRVVLAKVLLAAGCCWAEGVEPPAGSSLRVGWLTMEETVRIALASNPDLEAKRAVVDMARGRVRQAGAWPNPILGVSVEDVPAQPIDVPNGKQLVELEQVVSLGGKIGWKERAALLRLSLAEEEYRVAEREVAYHTRDRFVQVLVAQERKGLSESESSLAREMLILVEALVQAGAVSSVELTKAQMESAKSQGELEESVVRFQLAQTELHAVIGRPGMAAKMYDGVLADEVKWPSSEEEVQKRLAAHPALHVEALAKEVAEVEAGLARAESWPDISVRLGVGRGEGGGGSVVQGGIAFPLPLFDARHGAIQEAEAVVRVAEAGRQVRIRQIHQEWRDVTNRMDLAMKQVTRYRHTILPGAERVLESVREGYQKGKFRYIEVLEAQRTLAGARRMLLESLDVLNRGRWLVEQWLGTGQEDGGGKK